MRSFLTIALCSLLVFCTGKSSDEEVQIEIQHNELNIPKFNNKNNVIEPKNDYMDSLISVNKQLMQNVNCQSINEILKTIYLIDQHYRDSVNYYKSRDIEKSHFFSKRMIKADGISSKMLSPLIGFLSKNVDCIDNEKSFDAIWLVAVHNNNLINDIRPIIDYGYKNSYIKEDSYELYMKRYHTIISSNNSNIQKIVKAI
ncbi:hypothetical protein ACFSKL_22680 [Belliella marina]|uniref:Uncharacterized protein n=1 Tax=Belliella marina TaxID=1644146 RepID=A0ABW4VW95_9BACT